jgi:plastocyanin
MSQPKGSTGIAIAIAVLVVIAVTSVGYYQFVYCTSSCSTSTSSSSAAAAGGCTPPSCITIQIAYGAATLTTTAYSPDTVKLVIGVNNSFQFRNNDSESGGVPHTATAKDCVGAPASACTFDTGILNYNQTSQIFKITAPGTYPYYCQVHPSTMVGTIVVVAGNGASNSQSSTSASSSSGSNSSGSSSSASSSTASNSSVAAPANGILISMPNGAGANTSSTAAISGFSPGNTTVVAGVNSTILWVNNDVADHTIVSMSVPSGANSFSSQLIKPSGTFNVTLSVPGVYKYACGIHPWMKGEIIVKAGK